MTPERRARVRRVTLVLALLMSVAAVVGVHHRASKGRNALLKWEPAFVALESGETIYERGAEGHPTLPVTLLGLSPFRALGPTLGPVAYAAFCVLLAWWIVLGALRLAAGRAGDFPAWGQLAVLLLSFRVLHSEIQHGNVNLVVGAVVVAAVVAWHQGRDFAAGLAAGCGAVLKVTPALLLVFFAWKRSARGLVGFAAGVALLALVVPGLWLGQERNLELAGGWWRQMVAPYLAGREVTLLQSEHVNQSLLGVLARWTTDAVAIPARPPELLHDVRVNVVELSPAAFRALHLGAVALVLAWLVAHLRPREDRSGPTVLGEASLFALAMVLCSERSWKHHFVLLPLPLALLCWHLRRDAPPAARRLSAAGLASAGVLFGLTGEAVLGEHGSNLAEAWGAYALGALVLFLVAGRLTAAGTGSRGEEFEKRASSGP